MKVSVLFCTEFGYFNAIANVTEYEPATTTRDINGLRTEPDIPETVEFDIVALKLNGVKITQKKLIEVFAEEFACGSRFQSTVIDKYKEMLEEN